MKLVVRGDIVRNTLSILRASGELNREGVALWFGRSDGVITNCIEPIHRADYGMFHIPKDGIAQIMTLCKTERVRLLAQVHSHPGAAFHSEADDQWAIPRHIGALSIVIPEFAGQTSVATFLEDAATYVLSDDGTWMAVESADIPDAIEIMR